MAILLVAELFGADLAADATSKAVAAVRDLGEVTVLVAGRDCRGAADAAARIEGVAEVLCADDPVYAHQLAEPMAALIVGLAGRFDHIAAPATTTAKNILPRVAALLDVMIISDVIALSGPDTFKRPIYAGNAVQTVRSTDSKKVLTIRTASFEAAGVQEPAAVELIAASEDPGLSSWVEERAGDAERPDLSSARIVVAGGRGLGSKDNFALVEKLAGKLGGAIGASRAAVDAGYAPNDLQVGQTGKIVAPDLYIAVGISGAIQHLAGMKDAKVIVAINKDAEAPIFRVADYGLVGDLFELVPELTEKL